MVSQVQHQPHCHQHWLGPLPCFFSLCALCSWPSEPPHEASDDPACYDLPYQSREFTHSIAHHLPYLTARTWNERIARQTRFPTLLSPARLSRSRYAGPRTKYHQRVLHVLVSASRLTPGVIVVEAAVEVQLTVVIDCIACKNPEDKVALDAKP